MAVWIATMAPGARSVFGHRTVAGSAGRGHRRRRHRRWLTGGRPRPRGLGLEDAFRSAGAATARYRVPYDELVLPEVAESAAQDTAALLAGVEGALCDSHPAVCRALAEAAAHAGAEVIRGVGQARLEAGRRPAVTVRGAGERRLRPRLVVGADGRDSSVRAQAGITLQRAEPRHLSSGLLAAGMAGWPADRYSLGTEGDLRFLIFPQPGGRLRLYACLGLEDAHRWAGPGGPRRFLDTFSGLRCLPDAERFRSAEVAGPCGTFTAEDTWADTPYGEGVVLAGDAAGYNDPNIRQGASGPSGGAHRGSLRRYV